MRRGVMADEARRLQSWRRGAAAGAVLALIAGACVTVQVVSAPPASAAAPGPAPAGQWQFGEGSGTTTADSSGNSHTGTLGSGVTWAAPEVGAHSIAASVTATGAVTVTGPVVNTAASYTASAWVYLNGIGGSQETFVSINGLASPVSNTVSGFFLQFQPSTDGFAFTLRASDATGSAVTQALEPSNTVVIHTWYHIVGVYDSVAKTIALYVNGALQQTTAFTTAWQATGNTMIGQGMYNGTAVDWFGGRIDDVALYSSALTAAQVAALNPPVIATGLTTSCEISSGNAYCWGDNSTGTLGDNSTVNSSVPVPVYTGTGVLAGLTLTQLSVGSDFACALSSAGAAYCWGFNSSGQLGNSTTTSSNVPVLVSGGLTFTQIDVGSTFACALTSAGAAYCWGNDGQDQLGNTTLATNTDVPTAVTGGLTFTQISTGTSFACALTSAGAAYCWGKDSAGQIGNAAAANPQSAPLAVTTAGTPLAGVTLTQISAALSGSTACALSSAGAAYCWGLGTNGELGNGSTTAAQTTAVAVTATGALAGVTLTQIDGGQDQTCALGSAGAAYCWGGDTDGDLGISSTTQSLVPVAVSTSGVLSGKVLTGVSATGNFITCALDSYGTAYCWGLNNVGQAGNPDTGINFTAPVTVTPVAATISAGTNHSCEIRSGKAYCWGDNSKGELGNSTTIGTTFTSTVPVAVYTGGALSGVTLTQISAGNTFTCALSAVGAAYCWGLGTSGQLGNAAIVNSSVPVAVSASGVLAGATLTQISAGNGSACAVSSAGAAYCWGLDSSGQLGNNSLIQNPTPVAVTTAGTPLAGATLTQVSAGDDSACALGSTGAAYCWGVNTQGQLGNGTLTTPQETATAVTTAGTALAGVTLTQVSASAAGDQTCALGSTGAAYCWGQDASGQLGNGTTSTTQDTAVAVTATGVLAGVVLTQVSSGKDQGCALSSAGAAYCWGGNTDGDLGNNSAIQSTTAVAVTATGVLAGIVLTQVTGAYNFACALSSAGAAYCWGFNTSSQLGNPVTADNFLVPVAVTSRATIVASGYDHSCLLRNGRAFCWGDDSSGQLGNGSSTGNFTTPVAVTVGGSSAIPTGTTLTQITTANSFTCALASTGAAYCWGAGGSGQLGNSGTATSDVPVLVSGGLTFTQISAGTNFACALTSAGAAYCWGANSNGQQGNNGTTASSTPGPVTVGGSSAIPTGTTLTQISAGYGYACALGSTGAAYCWGLNTNGQLGNGTVTSPAKLATAVSLGAMPTGTILTQIAVTVWSGATDSTCALSAAGAAYCWGDDTYGELGNGITTSTPQETAVAVSPGAMPAGTTLTQVTVGTNFACALGSAGAAYCWGLGTGDQLGDNLITTSNLPVAVTATGALAGVTLFQISSGQLATCTQDTTGTFYCWGGNGNGQLGNGSTTSSPVPVVVLGIIPGPPTGVSATPGDTTATISWTAPASLGTGTLTGYTATATAASGTFTCTTPSAVTCVISGLTDGTTYSVTVVTLTTDGSSLPSSPAVNVEPIGFLSLTSPTSLTWAVTGNGSNQSAVDAVSGDEQLTATDNTVTGNGWHITVSATTFTTGTYTLPNTGAAGFTGSILSSQASTAPTATCVGSCTLPADTTIYPVAITTAASSPTTYTIYDTPAATGEGVMTLGGSSAANPIGWWVQAPASTRAGIYTSTVTLQVVSGP